jgi:hypothetical protein
VMPVSTMKAGICVVLPEPVSPTRTMVWFFLRARVAERVASRLWRRSLLAGGVKLPARAAGLQPTAAAATLQAHRSLSMRAATRDYCVQPLLRSASHSLLWSATVVGSHDCERPLPDPPPMPIPRIRRGALASPPQQDAPSIPTLEPPSPTLEPPSPTLEPPSSTLEQPSPTLELRVAWRGVVSWALFLWHCLARGSTGLRA